MKIDRGRQSSLVLTVIGLLVVFLFCSRCSDDAPYHRPDYGLNDGMNYSNHTWNKIEAYPNAVAQTIAISSKNRVVALTSSELIFYSVDRGVTWDTLQLSNDQFYCAAYNSTDDLFLANGKGEIYVSSNQGTGWTVLDTKSIWANILSLEFKDDIIYAGSNFGLYISTNGGLDWTRPILGLDRVAVSALTILPDYSVLIGSPNKGIYKLLPGGAEWISSSTGLPETKIISLVTTQEGHVFAGTPNDGVFLSTDKGESWNAVNEGLTDLRIKCLDINSQDIIVALTGDGLFITYNQGNTWKKYPFEIECDQIISIAFDAGGYLFASCIDGAMFLSPQSTIKGEDDYSSN